LNDTIAGAHDATPAQNDTRMYLRETLARLRDLRNRRLSDNGETLPPVLWAALLAGAVITVGFGFLFGVKNFRIQLIMTGAVAALIAMMFTLLVELDFPFRRDTAISANRWINLQRFLGLPSDGGR
jgi:high-affinity Fe2+/Pb2+ permease